MNPNVNINAQAFTPEQQDQIKAIMAGVVTRLATLTPQLGPHFLSGGIFQISTMSGLNLKFGFEPMGGLIIPGGIAPQNGGLIK